MQVAIAGGHGKIALHVTRLLLGTGGHGVYSIVRNPAHEAELEELGATPIRCDLEASSVPEIVAALRDDVQAVVFAAGAGPGSGSERKETMDYEGAVKLMEAARERAIGRYLMVSAMAADPDHPGEEVFDVYLRAKGKADAELRASDLDWTVVRPGMLTDDPGTGLVDAGATVARGAIPREDVAAALAHCLETGAASRMTFDLVSGETPIAEAIDALNGLNG